MSCYVQNNSILGKFQKISNIFSTIATQADNNILCAPKASISKKWTKILRPIWNEIQLTGLNSEYTNDSGDNDEYLDNGKLAFDCINHELLVAK